MEGYFDIDQFNNAIKRLIQDYLLLNSHIIEDNGQLFWVKNRIIHEVDHFKKPLSNQEIFSYIKKPFDLEKGPLYRFAVINNGVNNHRLITIFHHSIVNGIAAPFILNEASNYYNNKTYKTNIAFDFQVIKLTELFTKLSSNIKLNKNSYQSFWKEQLVNTKGLSLDFLQLKNPHKKISNILSVPEINPPMEQITRIGELRFNFDEEIAIKLNKLKKQCKITPYLYGQIVYAILLNLYTEQNKFCINYSISMPESFHFIYGAQINTTVIPYDFSKINTVIDVIEQARHFNHILKQNGIKYSDFPITEVLAFSNTNLLDFKFDQAFVRTKSIEFASLNSTINYEINVGLSNKLFIGQEISQNEIYYSIFYHLDLIDLSLLKVFTDCYKKLFIKILDELILSNNIEFKKLEDILLGNESSKKHIMSARKYINETNITTDNNLMSFYEHSHNNLLQTRIHIKEDCFKQILNTLNNINEKIFRTQELILIMGDPAEKNILLGYLTDTKSTTESTIEINLTEPSSDQNIIYTYSLHNDVINKKTYCVCPKFWEIVDPIQTIINAFFFYKLFDNVEEIKLIITIPSAYFENQGNLFINLISSLENLFENIYDFKDKLLFVITKINKKMTTNHIKEEIKNILEEKEIDLNLKQINILELLIANKNILLLSNNYDKKDQNTIFDAITKTKFVNKSALKTIITKRSKDYILAIFDKINEQILKGFEDLCNNIKIHYQTLLNNENYNSMNLLIKHIKFLLELINTEDISENVINQFTRLNPDIIPIADKIKHDFMIFNFCKYLIKEQVENKMLIKSINNILHNCMDYILGNAVNTSEKIVLFTLDLSIKDFENYINIQSMAELKKYINILDDLNNKLEFCNNQQEIQQILNEFKLVILSTDKFFSCVETLYDLNSENIFVGQLKTYTIMLQEKANDKLKALQQTLAINIYNLFKKLCNHIKNNLSSCSTDQLECVEDIITILKSDKSISLLVIIDNIEKIIIFNSPQLNISIIKDLIIELKELYKIDKAIIELDIQKYTTELLRIFNVIKINCRNLRVKDNCNTILN